MLTFIPLLKKYKIYTAFPVILAQIVDIIIWVFLMFENRMPFHRSHITKYQVYADIVYGTFCLPTLHFYKLYFILVFFLAAILINIILLYFMKTGNLGGVIDITYALENIKIVLIFVPLLEFTYQCWRRRIKCFK